MQQNLNESLAKITKGTGFAFAGFFASLLFAFISRTMIARYGTETEFGIFSLGLVVLNICVIVATLGFRQGVTRSIAYARGRNETEKARTIISVSLWISLVAGIILCLILLFSSGIIAENIYDKPELGFPLKIFAIAIPFSVLTSVLVSIFRGFQRVMPQIFFQDILRNVLFVLLLLGVIFLNLSFAGVFAAYLLSFVIVFVALAVYAVRHLPLRPRFTDRTGFSSVANNLLLFSLPLLGTAMLHVIVNTTDTLMLGYFNTMAAVGLYNSSHVLAQFISAPLDALRLIYMPVASGLYAQGLLSEMRSNFSILTKWLCSATLPLFLIVFLFPDVLLSFTFGANYAAAGDALRILSLGFIINNFLGPNGATLIAFGRSQFIMWATLATAVLNVALNLILIPLMGIEGAAIASVTAITCVNLVRCWKLYLLSGAQPLSRNLIKPTIVFIVLALAIYFISINFVSITLWILLMLFVLYYVIYFLAILITKSFDKEDLALLLNMEKRFGINATFIKRIIQRFL